MSNCLTIGIVACSSEGAALCYRTICERSAALLGPHAHPEVALHGASLAEYVEALNANDLEGVAAIMLRSAHRLADAGADFLICPDNTIHSAMDHFEAKSPLPLLHIAKVVVAEARRRDVRRAGILGTKWLVESDVYPSALENAGIEWLRPEPNERAEISRIIMEELVYGQFREVSKAYFRALIERMRERGCDAVILGCTEIPLIISDANSALPTLDSTRLLAEAAVQHAIVPMAATADQ
ncbi:aspartate/glutamate racemase family protein [Ancylobacter sp. FA202]|uniref:aspartate/glutamate racemase family protein n=1 Tax=Ancylobacter sp. FA202 TaxID=1111106 RepID=UPI00039F9231|nr:amino acid racemase [Ancylobacter sp. FA202]